MAKQSKKQIEAPAAVETTSFKQKRLHDLHPWSVEHHVGYSEIRAYLEITGQWEVVVEAKSINHIVVANFIISVVNVHNRDPNLVEEMAHALELCLESNDLNWESEQAADSVLRRIKRSNS